MTDGPPPGLTSRRELLRLFLAEKRDPEPFYRALAARTVQGWPFPLDGARVLDLGCGGGQLGAALAQAGAQVVGADLDVGDLARAGALGRPCVAADGARLAFPDAAFDGVVCSNVLEHTPDPAAVFAEIERMLVPGGWGWVSWTNWYSPWGGHEIVPLHYLGPRLGLALWRRLRGEPRKNVPFEGLWPTHIGPTLALVRAQPGLRLLDAMPRYYPAQRWILKVPGLREVATWNCVLLVERTGVPSGRPR